MQRKVIYLAALIIACIFGGGTPVAHAQTPAEVHQAINDARKDDLQALFRIKEQYGDKALRYFASARFDKSELVRRAAVYYATPTLESSLFVLPMIEDDNREIAALAVGILTVFASVQNNSQKLQAGQVVPRLSAALNKNPFLVKQNSSLLLLLSQFKNDPSARSLLGRLLKANGWDGFFIGNTPTTWDYRSVAALLAQCELGRLNAAQVLTVFTADPKARLLLLGHIGYVNNKTLLRYALSLLYDRTQIMSGMDDVVSPIVSLDAWRAFHRATKLEIRWVKVNGVTQYVDDAPVYDKEDISHLYAYYGLTEKPLDFVTTEPG